MAFSLSSWFKSKPSDEQGNDSAPNGSPAQDAAPVAPPAPMPAAPSSVRTVMPKSAQPVSLRDPGVRQPVTLTSAAPIPVTTNRIPAPRPPGRKITFPMPASGRPVLTMPTAGGGPAPVAVAVPPPPAPVAAPVPAPDVPDVVVSLEVGDFVDRLPPNFLNPAPFDRHHKIEFRASEVYSDLTKGRASVPASTIYAKVPSLFARPVTDTEDVEVSLPLQKLVEQLSAAFQMRADQVLEDNVGEIETPFLQVAKEDSERLPTAVGTVAGAIRPASPALSALSAEETAAGFPVRPAHRTGQISTISAPKVPLEVPALPQVPAAGTPATGPINPGKRPPSTVRASVAGGKIRLSGPSAVTRMSAAPVQPIPPGGAAAIPPTGAPVGPSTASQRIQLPLQGAGPASNPSLAVTKKTARIQIPPISLRAGGPGAAPRPGGMPPSVPVPVQPSPVSIRPPTGTDMPVTFRSSPPPPPTVKPPPSFAPTPRPSFAPPAFPAMPPVPAPATAAVPAVPVVSAPMPADDRKIELGLAAVLRGIPSEVLAVEPWTIADDVRFSLPFANIEKQLSLGRVSIGVDDFLQALPEAHRNVLAPESGLNEIQLPLPEIFQNLPSSALAIRPDQLVEETGSYYPTPFSQKADEDAARFDVPTTQPTEAKALPGSATEQVPTESPSLPVIEDAVSPEFIDQPLPVAEVPAPVVEPETSAEPARDIPLDHGEPAQPEDPVQDGLEAKPVEALTATVPGTVEDLPAEPAIEPPVAVEPVPVEEALAVLESTAPAEIPAATSPSTPANTSAAPPTPVALPKLAPDTLSASPQPVAASETTVLKGRDSNLQTLFMTEEELDAKAVVRLVCQLPGVSGCAVMFADGLRLAGNFPDGDAEGFSAMAPPFYKRTQNFVSELKLGRLQAFTVYTEKDLLSFFMHDDICVSVRHSGRGFLPGVREKLEIVTRELSGMYSTTKPAPSDYSL